MVCKIGQMEKTFLYISFGASKPTDKRKMEKRLENVQDIA